MAAVSHEECFGADQCPISPTKSGWATERSVNSTCAGACPPKTQPLMRLCYGTVFQELPGFLVAFSQRGCCGRGQIQLIHSNHIDHFHSVQPIPETVALQQKHRSLMLMAVPRVPPASNTSVYPSSGVFTHFTFFSPPATPISPWLMVHDIPRSLKMPPEPIADVLGAVLMLLGIRDTSWLSMKKFLGNRGVKEDILNFDARRIDPQLRAKVLQLIFILGRPASRP